MEATFKGEGRPDNIWPLEAQAINNDIYDETKVQSATYKGRQNNAWDQFCAEAFNSNDGASEGASIHPTTSEVGT